jgi:hypothetical protein
MTYVDALHYLTIGLATAGPTVLGFVSAWALFQLQERHKQSFAADSARQSLLAELKWLESQLSMTVIKCANQSPIFDRAIREFRWFYKEGIPSNTLQELSSEQLKLCEKAAASSDQEITDLLRLGFFRQESHAIEMPITITNSILATPTSAKLTAEEIKKLVAVRWQSTMLAAQARLMNENLRLTFTVLDETNHPIVKHNHAQSLGWYGMRAAYTLDYVRAALTELEKPRT